MSGAVPKLRFPEFSDTWRRTAFEDCLSPVPTKAYQIQTTDYKDTGRHPVVDQGDKDIVAFSDDSRRVFSDVPVVIFGDHTTNLKYVDFPFVVGADGVKLLKSQADDLRFIFSSLQANPIEQEGYKRHFSILREIKLGLPTISEQQKIADFLGTVDAKLEALRRKKAGLEAFKSGLMQRLFSQTLRFTRDDGTDFPDWEKVTLGELVEWQSTNNLSREFLTTEGGAYQNIHYGDIHGKFPPLFRQSEAEVPYVVVGAPIRTPKKADFCRPGDVVFADASEDYADIGKSIEIIEVEEDSLLAGLHTHLARPKDKRLAIGFTGYMMRTEPVRRQIMRFAQGISVLGISKDNLGKVQVQVPHPDEQRKIADALAALDAKIAAVADQITHMEAFKKGLLQQMFL